MYATSYPKRGMRVQKNAACGQALNTLVVNAEDLLPLYKNQVAVPKGATNSLCEVFEFVAKIAIVYQDPQKVGIGGTPGPTDHSYVLGQGAHCTLICHTTVTQISILAIQTSFQ